MFEEKNRRFHDFFIAPTPKSKKMPLLPEGLGEGAEGRGMKVVAFLLFYFTVLSLYCFSSSVTSTSNVV